MAGIPPARGLFLRRPGSDLVPPLSARLVFVPRVRSSRKQCHLPAFKADCQRKSLEGRIEQLPRSMMLVFVDAALLCFLDAIGVESSYDAGRDESLELLRRRDLGLYV